jgi:competence protein ComEA
MARADDTKRPSPATAAQPAVAPAGVVNINTANQEELARLPGIGPSKAKAIIEFRERAGKFNKVEDLLRVRGIGRKTLRDLYPLVALEGKTTLSAKAAGRKPSVAR